MLIFPKENCGRFRIATSNVSRAWKELFEKKILIEDSETGHVFLNSNLATMGVPKNFNKETMEKLKKSQVETEDFKII